LTRPLLILALLPVIGACRNADVLTTQEDNAQLRADLSEMALRVEALEADAAATITTLETHTEALAADREDIGTLTDEIETATGFDLVNLVNDVEDLDTRMATLEEITIASEEWVVGQDYATASSLGTLEATVDGNTATGSALQTTLDVAVGDITAVDVSLAAALVDVSALDVRSLSNAEGLVATSSAITTVDGRVDGQATQIEANASLIASVDERVSDVVDDVQVVAADVADNAANIGFLEGVTDGLTTDVSDIDAIIGSQGGGLADLQTGLDDLATESLIQADSIQANTDGLAALDITTGENASILGTVAERLEGLDGDVSGLSSATSTNASTLATYGERLEGFDSDISGLSSTSSTHTGLISGLRTDTNANTTSAASQGSELTSAQSAITSAQSAISALNGDLDATLDLIGENATAISDNALDITQVAADASEPRTIQRIVGQRNEGQDSGIIASRTLTFVKEHDDTTVRITWFDNRRTLGYSYGYWRGYIDGELCVDPKPMQWWHHSYGPRLDGDHYSDDHYNASLLGYCRATASGPIEAGTHTFTVEVVDVGGNRGDWYAGWNSTTFVVEMEEVY
jgi:archaellum component FlaC